MLKIDQKSLKKIQKKKNTLQDSDDYEVGQKLKDQQKEEKNEDIQEKRKKENEKKVKLNYSIEAIKRKYLFPFNQNIKKSYKILKILFL